MVSAVTGADAYPSGEAEAGIEPGDTLVFTVVVLSAS
ncbi:Peptidyl-prolyl cis-trans isomerase OS=Tsukamurella paurometabola (strain ATCC 8368 / DSM /CCUG 35730 / CIP 100753 / JCM 10117 / KCTC 9821 / NBRC 16120/ NCIMB 702349 / NCTC 13040) OX=521096 GN=Tpau_1496 PE=3 SV=1 [Tsukamurella paurometabola]